MSKPDDIPQDVWNTATVALYGSAPPEYVRANRVLISRCARAIMAAEKRGEERERAACAEMADYYASSNSEFLPEEVVIACGQTATDIAAAIRKRGEG
jgi:hypothetical protein